MLYHRYSFPLMLLDQYVETGRLCEFVLEFINIKNEEMKDKVRWEFYLNRVHDMTWEEYWNLAEKPEVNEADMDKIEDQVKKSMNILESFKMN